MIMKRIILLLVGLGFFTIKNQAQTITDIDGNNYNIVTIDQQYWMKENLKVIHFTNGDIIPEVIDSIDWSNLLTGAWCDESNLDSLSNIYGRLYNYYTVIDQRGLCPVGWHIPNRNEIKQLIYSTGGKLTAGGRLKDTIFWEIPNIGANNSSGFSAIPSCNRFPEGIFKSQGYVAVWWLKDQVSENESYAFSLYADRETASFDNCSKNYGFTIRCLADSSNLQIIPDSIFFLSNRINNLIKIKIYPNPANDMIYIDNPEKQTFKMQVYNMVGECVLQKTLNNGDCSVNILDLSKGVFTIKLTGTDWTVNRKLTKQ